jgi:copper(I)-binding protein
MPQVNNARIVQPPPGSEVAAGYLTITNNTDKPLVITSASSDSIKIIEIHLSSVVDDVARMEKQASITIPAGESLEFTHGSFHLMMMGIDEPLQPGQTVNVILETSAGPLPVTLPVVSADEAAAMQEMNHDSMINMDHEGMQGMKHEGTAGKPPDPQNSSDE